MRVKNGVRKSILNNATNVIFEGSKRVKTYYSYVNWLLNWLPRVRISDGYFILPFIAARFLAEIGRNRQQKIPFYVGIVRFKITLVALLITVLRVVFAPHPNDICTYLTFLLWNSLFTIPRHEDEYHTSKTFEGNEPFLGSNYQTCTKPIR